MKGSREKSEEMYFKIWTSILNIPISPSPCVLVSLEPETTETHLLMTCRMHQKREVDTNVLICQSLQWFSNFTRKVFSTNGAGAIEAQAQVNDLLPKCHTL